MSTTRSRYQSVGASHRHDPKLLSSVADGRPDVSPSTSAAPQRPRERGATSQRGPPPTSQAKKVLGQSARPQNVYSPHDDEDSGALLTELSGQCRNCRQPGPQGGWAHVKITDPQGLALPLQAPES